MIILQFILYRHQTTIFRAANLSLLLLLNLNLFNIKYFSNIYKFLKHLECMPYDYVVSALWLEYPPLYNGRVCTDLNDSEDITPVA